MFSHTYRRFSITCSLVLRVREVEEVLRLRGAAALGEALMEAMDLDLLIVVRFVEDNVDEDDVVEDEDEGTAGRSNVGADWA
jgi:hypothetical protein